MAIGRTRGKLEGKKEEEEPDEAEFGMLLSPAFNRDKDGKAEEELFPAGTMVCFPRLQGIKVDDPETGEHLKILEDEFIIAAVEETKEKHVVIDNG